MFSGRIRAVIDRNKLTGGVRFVDEVECRIGLPNPGQMYFSIAFFLEVNPDSVVEPRDIVKGETSKHEPITCGDYLPGHIRRRGDADTSFPSDLSGV